MILRYCWQRPHDETLWWWGARYVSTPLGILGHIWSMVLKTLTQKHHILTITVVVLLKCSELEKNWKVFYSPRSRSAPCSSSATWSSSAAPCSSSVAPCSSSCAAWSSSAAPCTSSANPCRSSAPCSSSAAPCSSSAATVPQKTVFKYFSRATWRYDNRKTIMVGTDLSWVKHITG